jgi:hypothetical protein
LLFGGASQLSANGPIAADAELYNPGTGKFTILNAANSNLLPRENATATLLHNGLVLIAGGNNNACGGNNNLCAPGGSLNTAVVYNPKNKSFVNLPNMVADRDEATATLLPTGKVLIAGGVSYQLDLNTNPNPTFAYLGSAELFDPHTGTFAATGALAVARAAHTATLLSNGLVLLAGGYNTPATCVSPSYPFCTNQLNALTDAELYDLVTGTFSQTGSLNEGRSGAIAALLTNGQVLVAGGLGAFGDQLISAELFPY